MRVSDKRDGLPESFAGGQRSAQLDAAQLQAIADVPSGAAALAGAAIVLLLIGWLLLYFLVYLPRGMVG
jgi:hypothetical protein